MLLRYPSCFEDFHCIAADCPDSCCKEWDVAVDDRSAAFYQQLPGTLGDALRRHLFQDEEGNWYFGITEGRCPMWRTDGLCRIQAELGHDALCKTCRDFPRLTHDYGDFRELGLELSCPEVARLLLSQQWHWVEKDIPGGEDGDYDRETMEILLRTRETALELLLQSRPVEELLALLLLYGYHAQAEVDGAPEQPFDAELALHQAREFAKNGDSDAVLAFFRELEILSPVWPLRLARPNPAPWQPLHRNLARYFVERYWLQAVSDYDLVSRVKLAVISCLVIRLLGGDPVQTAQAYSKEIENDEDNIDALLDGAYTAPAFTDEKLLSILFNIP